MMRQKHQYFIYWFPPNNEYGQIFVTSGFKRDRVAKKFAKTHKFDRDTEFKVANRWEGDFIKYKKPPITYRVTDEKHNVERIHSK